MTKKIFTFFLALVASVGTMFANQVWPIIMDETTFATCNSNSAVVADFRHNDIDRFLYIWDNTYDGSVNIGLNSMGNTDGYLSLRVGPQEWAGAVSYLKDNGNSWQAAEQLRAAIVANPDNYYLHMAIKSTDNYSHCFYLYTEATKFVLGNHSVYDGPVYSDFTRDGAWQEFYIPMSTYASALASVTCSAGMGIFFMLSEGVSGAMLNLDAVYICDREFMENYIGSPYSITTESSNPEWGATAGDTTVTYMSEVEISATPNYGYHFVSWNDGNTSNPRTVSVTQDKTYTATFAKNVYSITTNAEHGSISGNSSAEYLDFVTLTVTPDYGYHFTQWSDGLKDNPRIFQITKDTTFTAEFAYDRVGTNAKLIDLTAIGTTIDEWTITEATLNATNSDEAAGKYVYKIKAGVASDSYINVEPNVVFQVKNNSSDLPNAFYVYPGKCYQFGGKNGILILKGTSAGDTIKLTVAAKGSTASNFADADGTYPKNAVAVSEDLTLPAKQAGAEGADEQGYTWKVLEFESLGGDVEIKEFAGGYRIKSIQICNQTSVWEETFSTRRGSTYVAQVQLANYFAWPYASQWFTGYNEGKDDVVEGNQYDNDYTNVSSYRVSIRGKKLNGGDKNTVGLFFSSYKPAEQNYVLFEGGLPTISNGGVLKLDVCAPEEDNGGTLNEMIITINNGIVLNIPATTLGAKLVTSTIEVNLPPVQIDSLKIAFNNAPSYRFISRMWIEDRYLVCYDGIYFYLDTVNQTAEVTANPIHYTGDITIPTHITHENVIYSVVGIGDCAFINSNNLTSITMESETPISVGNRAFEGVNCPFYVPCGSLEAYKVAWSEYASRLTYSPSKTCIFNISTTSANPEWGTTSGDTTALYLDEVEISAIPNYGYHFVRWNDYNTSNPRTVSVTQYKTYTATFAKNVYSITKNAEHGIISGNTSAEYMDEVTLTANPDYGYHFTQWSDGNTDNPRTIVLTQDTTFTAEFAKNTYTISTTSANPEWGTTAGDKSVLYLDEVEISAIPNYGYHFVRWNDNNTSNPRTVTVTTNETYTATFAKDIFSITKNAEHGSISGVSQAEYLDNVTLTVNPNYGYHFTQWSDGNTDNPRTIVLTQDTTFTAEIVIDRIGTCGDDNALTWTYDAETKTLTITGNGTLNSNYYFGIEAPTQMQKLVIGNEVTSIGDSAFYEMSSINHLIIGGSVATIGNYAFAECRNFDDITCFATIVPVINETTFANVGNKQYIYLFVPEARERAYHRDTYWGEFDIQVQQAEETTVTTNDVTVEPQDNAATLTWPTSNNAASYTIQITKDGVVFCTLVFNSNGQLTGIAFAPSRDGQAHAPAAIMTANGLQFTVTGLDSGTHYALTLQAKDNQENVLASYSSEFTTTSEGIATGVEEVSSSLQGGDRGRLILHNGHIFILRGDKTYTLQGQEVK